MPLMQYKAMDERGRMTTGSMEAANVADLEMRLTRMGLDLVNHAEARPGGAGRGRVGRRDLIGFCLQLEQLIGSGVPVIEALGDLRDSAEDRRMREVIAGMVESIEGGKTLSAAMEEYPQVFDAVLVNLVRAGELSGHVSTVLRSVTENLKWQDEQAAQVRKLMTYPAFVAVAVFGVLIFLMVFLVPQLVAFIRNMGQQLPLHTRILIETSQFVTHYWFVIVLVPVALALALATLIRVSPSVSYFVDDMKLRVWMIGPILKKMILARFATYFSLMYSSGIPVLECVRIAEGLVGNKAVAEATRRAGRQIADGASISAGFEFSGLFPPLVVRMLRVGETTGALDKALLNVSYFYDRDVRESMDRLQAMIGPAMTLLLGGMLFWVIFSVLGPIYDLISKIKF
ncbi:MAG: type II secretion system F family protein [Ectothiorhodospiraceae bacterium]|nr:type II secretion system F family protein [Chromatiales bacterium]MCP5156789.1 type II secretion system F family protein [Ectothiorhodospiraceae bacterium]